MILGIDTSNYTTSLAIVSDKGEILADERRALRVKAGEKGLRQSEALFQHLENLPALSGKLFEVYRQQIKAIAVSNKPRPAPGSYMPVFLAGLRFAQVISQALGVPLYCFSHQEGHIRACLHNKDSVNYGRFLAWHLSGGTSELLLVENGQIEIVGGSKDISFGQLLDRIGVVLGLGFPCGAELDDTALAAVEQIGRSEQVRKAIQPDRIADAGRKTSDVRIITGGKPLDGVSDAGRMTYDVRIITDGKPPDGVSDAFINPHAGTEGVSRKPLSRIPIDGLYCNLSGLETQAKHEAAGISAQGLSPRAFVYDVFCLVADCLNEISGKAADMYGVGIIVFCGGVSASDFLRKYISVNNINCVFCSKALSADNAAGIAMLGLDALRFK